MNFDVYIPHCKYQVKPHSFLWFSAACTVAIVHRNFYLAYANKEAWLLRLLANCQ